MLDLPPSRRLSASEHSEEIATITKLALDLAWKELKS
jgi:hypothetical protein